MCQLWSTYLHILLMKQIVNDHPNVITVKKTTQPILGNVRPILKVKYTSNISFPEAQNIVESYTAALGKSYASITKTAGVTVSCIDAATQTLSSQELQSSSYNAASSEASANSQRDRGGRVVRWCWVNFQCQGVLLIG